MKKFLQFAICVIVSIAQLHAQNNETSSYNSHSGNFLFGIKAGPNISSLSGDAIYNYSSKPGFHLGLAMDIPYSDKLSVQPEVFISLQGSGGFFLEDLNFWYINVPVMGKYNIWDVLFIEAGPQLSYLLSSNLEGNAFGGGTTLDATNKIDFGFGIGAGYKLNDNLYFQLRYNMGLINVIKDVTSKNRTLQLSATYFL